MTKNEQKVKMFIQKLQDENKELNVKTILMKSHDEELKELRKTVEAWEVTKKIWAKTLFDYKQQHEALGCQCRLRNHRNSEEGAKKRKDHI
jgi:flagellar biosynthesis regulator FlaF